MKSLASPWWLYLFLPVFCGFVALHRGQDSNYDLLNYHLYNPGAWLQGRLGRDLAAAGLQSYFNPLLDLPYYVLSRTWPAALLGFLMGAFQGSCGVLVCLIARRAFPESPKANAWLAIAALLTANFWTELGNTMGDNNTAPMVLAGVLCASSARKFANVSHATWLLLFSGIFAGVATGLKLTNAPYAIALGAAVSAAWPSSCAKRFRAAASVGIGAIAGFGVTGGYWLWKMGSQFGNPLFPQFGHVFPNPLTASGGITDTSWLPAHWWEYLAWPVIVSARPLRIGQLHLHSSIWPVFYALLVATAIVWIRAILRFNPHVGSSPTADGATYARSLIVWFTGIGFLLWMLVFSIGRYLVPIELLVPVSSWILIDQLGLIGRRRRAAAAVLALCSVFTLTGPHRIWDHQKWSRSAFTVVTPEFSDPAHTLIFMGSATPQAWMISFFPRAVIFAEIGGSFPQGPGFVDRILSMRHDARQTYVLREAHANPWFKDAEASKLAALKSVGIAFDVSKCQTYAAAIGREAVPYQLCPAE